MNVTKEHIKEAMTEYYISRHEEAPKEFDNSEQIEQITESEPVSNLLNFYLMNGSNIWHNNWFECRYYSEAIRTTIVYDSEYPSYFESVDELAEQLLATHKEIEAFEVKLAHKK